MTTAGRDYGVRRRQAAQPARSWSGAIGLGLRWQRMEADRETEKGRETEGHRKNSACAEEVVRVVSVIEQEREYDGAESLSQSVRSAWVLQELRVEEHCADTPCRQAAKGSAELLEALKGLPVPASMN